MLRTRFSLALTFSLLLAACGGSAAPASTSTGSPNAAGASSVAASAESTGSSGAGSSAAGAGSPGSVASKPASAAAAGSSGAASSTAGAASASSSGAASSAAVAGGAIKIGVIEALSGTLANQGKDNQDGFNLYLSSINNTVAGRKIEAVFSDAQGKPDVALTKAKQLVESQKVQILAGIQATPVCYAVAEYAKQAQVPLAVTGNCGAQGLTTNPKYASPYLARFTENATGQEDPASDWTAKNGFKKTILITSDFGAGLEHADVFASRLIELGGSIVQEMHPAFGTSDFGPFLTQLDQNADSIAAFLPGVDGLRFGEQYANYASQHKPQIIDLTGQITNAPNLPQLKDKAVGIVGVNLYSSTIDTPVHQAFVKQVQAKYPGRVISYDMAQGYAGAQILVAALDKVKGQVENKQAFLDALDATSLDTAKGTVKLDKYHDVVQNFYVYRIEKQGNGVGEKLLQTYKDVSQFWDRPEAEVLHFPFGKLKGKWAGMTKSQLDALIKTSGA